MKKAVKRILSIIIFLILVMLALAKVTSVLERKQSVERYADFFEQESDFDILFLGSSHVINGILPLELWNEMGMVSYNLGGYGNQLPTSYWVLKNALDYTTPKLVVVDVHYLDSDSKIRQSEEGIEQLHMSLDAFPLSINKVKGVMDLLDERRGEFLWDFIVYHNRWDQLEKNDIYMTPEVEKGAMSRILVNEEYEFTRIDSTERLEEETIGHEYLRKIIELCQGRNIDVLLVYVPFIASAEEQRAANSAYAIAEEYGVNYINLMYEEVVNLDIDCSDEYSHLNVSGAKKVTHFLGEYIKENYEIQDRRRDENYANWYDDYDKYKQYKLDNLKQQTLLQNYLMLLYDEDWDVTIALKSGSLFEKIEIVQKLLDNISSDAKIFYVEPEDMEWEAIITVRDKKAGQIVDEIMVHGEVDLQVYR